MLARMPPGCGAMLASSGASVASAGPGAVHLAPWAKFPAGYAPHRPEETVLHGLVRENLESFLAHARETYEWPLPRYVEQAFRGYLRCGVFAHGFLRFHCDERGQDLLVAFSCKGRGLCPSCGARQMCNTAAHLVDRVLPAVPVRQWVISLPFEIRRLAAFRAEVATAMGRIFIEEIARIEEQAAATSGAQHGAVNFLQRFGGSLNLNLHYHAIISDGVFLKSKVGQIPAGATLRTPRSHDAFSTGREPGRHVVDQPRSDRAPYAPASQQTGSWPAPRRR
ncbi:transposase zinc-binding domain-containing protein [Sorangium sp. So ce887]|uniref:transposase zinc-binding domain-containing protein n=1 Tax=Sorangium sp. So ce887 TaxID=3133324 RepID=UPI003F5E8EE8